MKKQVLYGIEYIVSDTILNVISVSKKEFELQLNSIMKQIKDVDTKEHFFVQSDGDCFLYRQSPTVNIYCKRFTLDTTDISFYMAIVEDGFTFKNGVKINDLLRH